MKRILLLGSGELGKEFVISAKRMGHYVIACDSYTRAPAMQVADRFEEIDMLNPDELREVIDFWKPDIIVPEIEAIATEVLYEAENNGIQVVPSARAVNLTMNRDAIRNRAAELGIKTAKFGYAEDKDELIKLVEGFNTKCVVKPVMSSSGKGQTVIDPNNELDTWLQAYHAWNYAKDNMRGNRLKVIVEEFINFDYEITLLTVKQKNDETLFCEPIGHIQENGDYQQSWQPHRVNTDALNEAKQMAKAITDDLGGAGLFGVEFFVKDDVVWFSELSPRPHDTGMVTLHTQNLSEFDLHLRAILGLPITNITCKPGASAVILSTHHKGKPIYSGIDEALEFNNTDVRIFGKPELRKNRRMGVVLADCTTSAISAANKIQINTIQ